MSTINALGKYVHLKLGDLTTPFLVDIILARKEQITLLLLAHCFLDGCTLL
jgi:hypothetical protein